MTNDTETRFRIELHGENSGLLDTLSSDSLEGLRERLIYKLESGFWTFNDGDTLKVVEGNRGFAYFIVDVPSLKAEQDYLYVYTDSYSTWNGNWATIRKVKGVWQQAIGDRKPKMWRTANGPEAKMQSLLRNDKKRELAIMRLRYED